MGLRAFEPVLITGTVTGTEVLGYTILLEARGLDI
jgi:hypothetical protein